MVEAIAERHPALETHFIHGTSSGSTHAMDQHVRRLALDHGKISVATFYSDPEDGDRTGVSHDHDGFISIDWLKQNTPFDRAEFYLCGPKAFLRAFAGGLSLAGIPADRIHYEFFGPAEEIMAA
jgi:nitric oxide dioxygenase